MNIQFYDGKNMQWLQCNHKYELDTEFLIEAWKEAQKSNSEVFFEWVLKKYKEKFRLTKAVIFLGVNGFKKICGDDTLTLKNFYRLSQKKKYIIATNNISTDPRNNSKSMQGKCIQYPFILGNDVKGSIVYYRKDEDFSVEEISTIAGAYSRYIGEVLMDWNSKNIKFGSEMWNFINVMSHEIRTPLNGISGMTQLLMDTGSNLTKAQWSYLNTLQDSNILLLCLINDMIDYSKLQFKNINIKKESFSITSVIEQAKNILSDKNKHNLIIQHKNIEYDLLLSDKSKILQIIVNLLSNAFKFTPEGNDIEITTDIIFPKEGLSSLELVISDTGTGIKEENLDHIYEPFFKEKETKGGMGLGLSIIKEILEHLGGKIFVETELNKGTKFRLVIPIEIDSVFDEWFSNKRTQICKLTIMIFINDATLNSKYIQLFKDNQIPHVTTDKPPNLEGIHVLITDSYDYRLFKNSSKTNILNCNEIQPIRNIVFPNILEKTTINVPQKELKNLKILLVEDDPTSTFYLTEILNSLGISYNQTRSCSKYEEAVNAIFEEQFDIFLVDMKLPDGNGIDLAQKIQSELSYSYFIVGMSAGTYKPSGGSFNDFLVKPIKKQTLATLLKNYFKLTNK